MLKGSKRELSAGGACVMMNTDGMIRKLDVSLYVKSKSGASGAVERSLTNVKGED